MKSPSIDWQRVVQRGALIGVIVLQWLAHHGGHSLLNWADQLEKTRKRMKAAPPRHRAARR
jgi:hypothetical protein